CCIGRSSCMRMDIDQAWNDQFPVRINHLCAGRLYSGLNSRDLVACYSNVAHCIELTRRVDNTTSFDNQIIFSCSERVWNTREHCCACSRPDKLTPIHCPSQVGSIFHRYAFLAKSPFSNLLFMSDRPPQRVVIRGVDPEIECGRFPAKAIVGESFIVEADIFADGHDSITCALAYRHEDDEEWFELPMEALGNDRWRAAFRADKLGQYIYTLSG